VHLLQHEGDHARLARRGPDQPQAVDLCQFRLGMFTQCVLVPRSTRPVDLGEPRYGCTHARCARNIRRTSLEPVRKIVEQGSFKRDALDHVPAALPRLHLLEALPLAPQNADAGRPEHLVAGKRIEVAAKLRDVHAHVRNRLRPVEQDGDAARVRELHDALDRVDGSDAVGDVHHRDEARPVGQSRLECGLIEHTALVEGHDLQLDAGLIADELPGHDVGVVLHGGEYDLVAGVDPRPEPRLRHQVDRFGRAAGPDDLFATGRAQPVADLVARGFVAFGGDLREVVDAAVDVGVAAGVVGLQRVDDGARLLRARAACPTR
jgi:hypothetical protein